MKFVDLPINIQRHMTVENFIISIACDIIAEASLGALTKNEVVTDLFKKATKEVDQIPDEKIRETMAAIDAALDQINSEKTELIEVVVLKAVPDLGMN